MVSTPRLSIKVLSRSELMPALHHVDNADHYGRQTGPFESCLRQ